LAGVRTMLFNSYEYLIYFLPLSLAAAKICVDIRS
jgi:hypothetical protein